MFDIGWGKILIVGIVALIVIGPHELPGLLKTLGATVAKLKRMAADFQYQFNQALHESGVNEVQSSLNEATNFDPVSIARDNLRSAIEDIKPQISSSSEPQNEMQGPLQQDPALPSDFHVAPVLASAPLEPIIEAAPAVSPAKSSTKRKKEKGTSNE